MANITSTNTSSSVGLSKEITTFSRLIPLNILIIIATLFLNLYIIIIIVTNKKLRIPANLFIGSICVCGIIIACIHMPIQSIYVTANYEWNYGSFACALWYILDFSVSTISILNFIIITIIRYMSITKPHSDWTTKKRQILILFLVWIVPLTTWSIVLNASIYQAELKPLECYFPLKSSYLLIFDLFSFLIPFIVLISVNIKLILELRKRSKKVVNEKTPCNLVNKPGEQDHSIIGIVKYYFNIFNIKF
jgi:hypothetical protein